MKIYNNLFPQLTNLIVVVDNIMSNQDFLNIEMDKQFHENRVLRLRELALNKDFLSGILFYLHQYSTLLNPSSYSWDV